MEKSKANTDRWNKAYYNDEADGKKKKLQDTVCYIFIPRCQTNAAYLKFLGCRICTVERTIN